MASLRRPRKSSTPKPQTLAGGPTVEIPVPNHFCCPISLDLMKDPVTVSTGITYDRQSIETWFDTGNSTCPVTNQELAVDDLIPNHSLRRMIQDWCVANRSNGVERIPTPKIPITKAEASEMLSKIALLSSSGGNLDRCCELVAKVGELAKESERNRRCLKAAGAGQVLAASFRQFASDGSAIMLVLEEILSTLTSMIPLDAKACELFSSKEPISSIVSILKSGSLAARLNAVLVLKDLVANDREVMRIASFTEGIMEALVEIIREPISPRATKAALMASFFLISNGGKKIVAKFVDLGMVPLVLEILVDSEKATVERALAVFDGLCGCERGREAAYDHALTVPVLVKKMFRVSEAATEFVVSALWKLCKNYKRGEEGGEGGILVEALQVGAFHKVLLLLQVGCSGANKEKATELLKLLNGSRGKLDCIDVMDLKGLNRHF